MQTPTMLPAAGTYAGNTYAGYGVDPGILWPASLNEGIVPGATQGQCTLCEGIKSMKLYWFVAIAIGYFIGSYFPWRPL